MTKDALPEGERQNAGIVGPLQGPNSNWLVTWGYIRFAHFTPGFIGVSPLATEDTGFSTSKSDQRCVRIHYGLKLAPWGAQPPVVVFREAAPFAAITINA